MTDQEKAAIDDAILRLKNEHAQALADAEARHVKALADAKSAHDDRLTALQANVEARDSKISDLSNALKASESKASLWETHATKISEWVRSARQSVTGAFDSVLSSIDGTPEAKAVALAKAQAAKAAALAEAEKHQGIIDAVK